MSDYSMCILKTVRAKRGCVLLCFAVVMMFALALDNPLFPLERTPGEESEGREYGLSIGEMDGELIAVVQEKIQRAHERLSKPVHYLRYNVTENQGEGEKTSIATLSNKNSLHRLVSVEWAQGSESGTDIYSSNSDYRFWIRRAGTEGQWVVQGIELKDTKDEDVAISIGDRIDLTSNALATYCHCGLSIPIPNLVGRIVSAEETVNSAQAKIILVEFIPSNSAKKLGLTRGRIWLNPDYDWMPTQIELTASDSSIGSFVDKYDDFRVVDGHYFPFRKVSLKGVRDSKPFSTDVSEIEELDINGSKRLSTKKYYLSEYGLPEPDGVRRGVPIFVWLIISGAILMVLAVGFAVVRRRH